MKIKVGGVWSIEHVRDGKVINSFQARNNLTRRGAFDVFMRFVGFFGNNGGHVPTGRVPATEGAELQDFIAQFGWGSFFIEQEGDGVLNNGGDYDSGRGIHRDDRVRYWEQGNSGNTIAADNREWDGDLHSTFGDGPRGNNTLDQISYTTYNDGIPIPLGGFANWPRNATSFEYYETYRAGGNRSFRGIWWFQYRNTSGFGQSSVVSSVIFPQILIMRKFDYLNMIYKLSFDTSVAV